MTIIIVIRSSRLLIVVRIVTTIMHSSQTDDHQVWTSTVLHALYPPVYIYCTAISFPRLFLWSNIVLYPLHLLYLLFILSLSLCFLLTSPPPLHFLTFSSSLPSVRNWDILIHIHLMTQHFKQRLLVSDELTLSGYGWKDIVHSHIFCWCMTGMTGMTGILNLIMITLCPDIVTLLPIRIYFLCKLYSSS